MLATIESASCLESALFLHDIGLPVVICRGRTPLASDWRTHEYSANEIKRKFDSAPDLNFGVVLGPHSGLIEIIEPTNEHGLPDTYDLRELLNHDVPETLAIASHGADHRLFAWEDGLESLDWPVVNIRSLTIRTGAGESGAYTLLPPSIINSVPCEWRVTLDDYGGDPARLPDHFIDEIIDARFVGCQKEADAGHWIEHLANPSRDAFRYLMVST